MTSLEITKAYIGDSQVDKIYLGTEQVYYESPEIDYSLEYFTIEALSSGTLTLNSSGVSYSINEAEWVTMDAAGSIELYAGDKVRMGGNLGTLLNLFSGNTLSFKVYGNIQSLCYYGDNFSEHTESKTAQTMFNGCTGLVDASNLILPATSLVSNAYYSMFLACSSLVYPPELPATTLATNCYSRMFKGCTSLVSAPVLPATNLFKNCYSYMFFDCTSLLSPPELPATTLVAECYSNMFKGCTSITTAPVLSATVLTSYTYNMMFSGCTSLTDVTCLATNLSGTKPTNNWLAGVASTGTFRKNPNMTSWTSGASGIPDGWTVEDAEA